MFNWLEKFFHIEPEKNCSTCDHAREDLFKNHYHCNREFKKWEDAGGRNRILLADFSDTAYFPCEFHSPK